jgi:hypothetical protein
VTTPGGGSATRVGGFGVTAPGAPPPPPPPPPGMTLVWNGKVRDRTGPAEGAPAPDGLMDGTLTATVTGPTRTVKQVVLVASGAASGRWDTIPGNSYWVLAVAANLDATPLNAADGSVNFGVVDGSTFAVFGTDWNNGKFVAGTTLALTVTFTDDTASTASVITP